LNEGWYQHNNLNPNKPISYHYMINYRNEIVKSRCGMIVPTIEEIGEMILVKLSETIAKITCGNCKRLTEYDDNPVNKEFHKEPFRY